MSTLNSKLKKVSSDTIKLMTGAGKGMALSAYTAEGGSISSNLYIGFKQPSKASTADPYQIQYKVRYTYTAANQKKKGAVYTYAWDKLTWRNARKFTKSNVVHDVGELDKKFSVNSWECANKPVNTAGDYATFINLKDKKVASGYAAVHYKIRVRTYNKKTNKHGEWSYSETLTVYKAASMQDEVIHRNVDGGMLMDFNYAWDLGGNLVIEKVLDSNSVNILKSKLTMTVDEDTNRTTASNPPKRSGWTPGEVRLLPEKLTRAPEYGEYLYVTAYYKTTKGAMTYWKNKAGAKCQVANEDLELDPPRLVVNKNTASGLVIASVYKSDAMDLITKVSASASYELNGETVSISPKWTDGKLADMTTDNPVKYYFMAPLNVALKVTASFSSTYSTSGPATTQVRSTSKTVMLKNAGCFYLNSESVRLRCACVVGDWDVSEGFKGKSTIQEVVGRSNPFAVFGTSRTHEITLKGSLIEDYKLVDKYNLEYGTYAKWKNIAEHPGVYTLRTPMGDVIKVAVTSVDLSRRNTKFTDLQVTMTEVQ